MSDDPKEKETPEPTVDHKQEPEREPGNTVPFVPFVPYDDASMNPHIYARRWRPTAAMLDTNNSQVFPPLLNPNRGKTVHYVDFGFTSAREYWAEVVLPAYECFKADPSRGKAIIASFPAWHVQDWIWHEQHPGEDIRNSKDHTQFQEKLFDDCPELTWIRDVADAGKHRGLGRSTVEVYEVINTWPLNTTPSIIKLNDGTEHEFADVMLRVIEYWRTKYFL
jgi:hypothetical protein